MFQFLNHWIALFDRRYHHSEKANKNYRWLLVNISFSFCFLSFYDVYLNLFFYKSCNAFKINYLNKKNIINISVFQLKFDFINSLIIHWPPGIKKNFILEKNSFWIFFSQKIKSKFKNSFNNSLYKKCTCLSW